VTTPLDEAKELLLVVATPSALVTGTFLAFAGRAIMENQAKVDRARMWFALGASLAAVGLSTALTWLLAPLAFDHLWTYQGEVEPILVVYWMILLSVAGTAVFSAWTVVRCVRELRRPPE
jgi:hypothetical protein